MIPFWIGIFLLHIKGLKSSSLGSQLNTMPEVDIILERAKTSHNVTEPYKVDVCNCTLKLLSLSYLQGNEYLLTFSHNRAQFNDEIIQIDCISNSTGQEADIFTSHHTENGIILNIEHLIENEFYIVIVTYEFNPQCSNCTVWLDFKASGRHKRNLPVFVGMVAVVTMMIIAMCFYNIRSKCIYRYIQEIKRIPFSDNSTNKISPEIDLTKRFTQDEINVLFAAKQENLTRLIFGTSTERLH